MDARQHGLAQVTRRNIGMMGGFFKLPPDLEGAREDALELLREEDIAVIIIDRRRKFTVTHD